MNGIDRGAIFNGIIIRNALRREVRLPPLDVRASYHRAVDYAEWSAHVAEHQEAARAEVLRKQRRRHGPGYPSSGGGLLAIGVLTHAALRRSFAAQRSQRS